MYRCTDMPSFAANECDSLEREIYSALATRLFECHGKRDFYINAEGTVSVELLSADGKVLAKSEEFRGNSTAYKMNFDDFDVSALNSTPFRLRFHVSGKLYSFGLADENGDFGGAHAAGLVK